MKNTVVIILAYVLLAGCTIISIKDNCNTKLTPDSKEFTVYYCLSSTSSLDEGVKLQLLVKFDGKMPKDWSGSSHKQFVAGISGYQISHVSQTESGPLIVYLKEEGAVQGCSLAVNYQQLWEVLFGRLKEFSPGEHYECRRNYRVDSPTHITTLFD